MFLILKILVPILAHLLSLLFDIYQIRCDGKNIQCTPIIFLFQMTNRYPLSAHTSILLEGVSNVFHVSRDKSTKLLASDENGTLVQMDTVSFKTTEKNTQGRDEGYHTFTQKGETIIAYRNLKIFAVERIQNKKEVFIHNETDEWTPLSIHSSQITGDILVGMIKDGEAKVNWYNKTGRKPKYSIQWQNDGNSLYSLPHYITETKRNRYICVSDRNKEAVVVVDSNRQYKPEALYTGQGPRFVPFGICTDDRDHVLVCDGHGESIHLLDYNCRFLCLLPTIQLEVEHPRSVCVDDQKYLWVGQQDTNTVKVYKII